MPHDPIADLERLRRQFDRSPYPINPIEMSPRGDANFLFQHAVVTAFYRRDRRVVSSEGMTILDVGCGTGYGALALAEANPGAKVVGVDLSEASIAIARERLQYHGFGDAEFYALPLERLPELGLQFDYINCDETLYLVPDVRAGLQAIAAVLAPTGMVRANLHDLYGRASYFRAQRLASFLGLTEDDPGPLECSVMRDLLANLRDGIDLKAETYQRRPQDFDGDRMVAMNFFLAGDKGYTIPETLELLAGAGLELVSMVDWPTWDIRTLFRDPDKLPEYLEAFLTVAPTEAQLYLYELLHPSAHRLLDFWAAPHHATQPTPHPAGWSEIAWRRATVRLHPQLANAPFFADLFFADLESAIARSVPFDIARHLHVTLAASKSLVAPATVCLYALRDRPKTVSELVEHWLQLRPFHWVTGQAVTEAEASADVRQALLDLEASLFVLLSRSERDD